MYSRFNALEEYTGKDMVRLQDSTVAVVGLGATGSVIAENLARHGVNLILVDRDYLEEKDVYSSNLYDMSQCKNSLPKAKAAEEKLNGFTEVKSFVESLSPGNISRIKGADIILDGTDNLETRYLINDYSKKKNIPWIYTAAIAEKAYSMVFDNKCFNCMVNQPESVATCATDGIMREVAQKAAASTSQKAVEILTGKEIDEELELVQRGRSLDVESSGCGVCRGENYPHLSESKEVLKVCGTGKFQLEKSFSRGEVEGLDVGQLLAENEFLIRYRYSGHEIAFFDSGRIIVEAEDEGHAEAIVGEILGF